MFRKKKTDEIDVQSLNELIGLGKRILSISFTLIIIAVILLGLYLLRALNVFSIIADVIAVISPVFIGILIAWLFDPMVDFFQKRKFPRILGCIIVYLIFIGILSFIIFLLVPSFIDQIADFVSTIPNFLGDAKDFISGLLTKFNSSTDIDVSSIKKQVFDSLESIGTGLTTGLPNTIFAIGKNIVSVGATVVFGLMIGFYLLYDYDKVSRGILNMIPKRYHDDAKDLYKRINHSLREYITGLLGVMSLVFVSQSICLTIAGLEAPLVFALFCALTDIIPYFGPYIGAIPAVLAGFTISPFTGICCIIAIVIVQLLENNFYQPLIMGHAMKLHPVTIMLGLLIFQHFFGIIGMIVATPVIATLKVIFTFIDEKIEVMQKIRDN